MTERSSAEAPDFRLVAGRGTRSTASVRRMLIAIVVGAAGLTVFAAALAANQAWFDRHFLPSFFLPRRSYWIIYEGVRSVLAVCGAALVASARALAARMTARVLRRALQLAIAAVLALGCAELVLRQLHLRPTEWLMPDEEPKRRPDGWLGWTLVPARVGSATVAGRAITYAMDVHGYRVRRIDEAVDVERPTIVFIGESVMFGEGLAWDETIPAQVGMMTNRQSANLAVHGYSSDQAYLRLQEELPRFRRPVAVVSLFMTALFGRNLDDDRPHLGRGLAWLPAAEHARLRWLAGLLVPYRRDDAVRRGVARTREVLHATVDLAQARGATALIVVPQFGVETAAERSLRGRILDEAHLPYAFLQMDEGWRLSWDRHPNPRAAHAIAAAAASALASEAPFSTREVEPHVRASDAVQ